MMPYSFTLRELDASFVVKTDEGWRLVDALEGADGVYLLCPRCFKKNAGPIGTHRLLHWFEGRVADDVEPGPGRWNPRGTGLDDLTFVPGKKSCSIGVGSHMHGYIKGGRFEVDQEGAE